MTTTSTAIDVRKQYVLRLASHYFSLNLSDDKLSTDQQMAINRFLDTNSTPLLTVTRIDPKAGSIVISNQIDVNNNEKRRQRIVFYKTNNQPLSADDYRQNIQLITIDDAPANTLYRAIHSVILTIVTYC
jgi:hypothetical protein